METVLINGIEVPAPETSSILHNETYFWLNNNGEARVAIWVNDPYDLARLENGIVWKTLEHAELAAKAYAQKPAEQVVSDAITNPTHYQLLPGVEVIDVRERLLQKIEAAIKDGQIEMTLEQIDAWSRAWEYMTRFMEKCGMDDLLKAENYLHRCIHGEWKK